MSLKETKKVYETINTQIMQKSPKNMQIIDCMDLLDEIKGNWLTKEEKESFEAGLWMFNTLDTSIKSNKKYINEEQLKYVKQAVLGNEFKAASVGKYYAEYKEYKYKY